MKFLFLDHDGVLCLPSDYFSYKPTTWGTPNFNKKAVEILNKLLDKFPELEIVVSSDWRIYLSLEEMRDFYKSQGIRRGPISFTGYVDCDSVIKLDSSRVKEIQIWLKQHNKGLIPSKGWVVVDDLNLSELGQNFVRCINEDEGIKQIGILEKIIKVLEK